MIASACPDTTRGAVHRLAAPRAGTGPDASFFGINRQAALIAVRARTRTAGSDDCRQYHWAWPAHLIPLILCLQASGLDMIGALALLAVVIGARRPRFHPIMPDDLAAFCLNSPDCLPQNVVDARKTPYTPTPRTHKHPDSAAMRWDRATVGVDTAAPPVITLGPYTVMVSSRTPRCAGSVSSPVQSQSRATSQQRLCPSSCSCPSSRKTRLPPRTPQRRCEPVSLEFAFPQRKRQLRRSALWAGPHVPVPVLTGTVGAF